MNLNFSRAIRVSVFLAVLAGFAATARAQDVPKFVPEGRPTAGVQVGTPTPDAAAGVTFERNRIKRTPVLEPKTAIEESRWDVLYAATEASGPKVAYFDWDSDNIYIAWESQSPEPVRFDLDGADDGFLRGSDNLRIQIDQPVSLDADAYSTKIPVTAEFWDASKNGSIPARSVAPIAPSAITAAGGRTSKGTYVVMVAIGQTELVGFPRTANRKFGLRIESGPPAAAPDGTTLISNRPFIHLTLADRVEATQENVHVTLKILSDAGLVPGDGLRAVLEAKNEGTAPITLSRLFVRGSQASLPFVDSASFTGVTLGPGQSTKRELRSTVAPDTPVGTQVISGGAEWKPDNGGDAKPVTVAALASFDRVEPYYIKLDTDRSPVPVSSERSVGGTKIANIVVGSRVNDTVRAEVSLKLPTGWSIDGDSADRVTVLGRDGDIRQLRYKIQVPGATAPGLYVISGSVKIENIVYSTAATVSVVTAPPPAPPKPKKKE